MVARARSPLGPFEKLSRSTGSEHSAILLGNDKWRAPGHNAVVRDAQGTDWLVYHAADANQLTAKDGLIRRPMLMDRLVYENGWPAVSGGSPSVAQQHGPMVE
jgi:arabinan endo-1,5-alpha-L-arabinosidase